MAGPHDLQRRAQTTALPALWAQGSFCFVTAQRISKACALGPHHAFAQVCGRAAHCSLRTAVERAPLVVGCWAVGQMPPPVGLKMTHPRRNLCSPGCCLTCVKAQAWKFLADAPEEDQPTWPEPEQLAAALQDWRQWTVLTPALRRTLACLDGAGTVGPAGRFKALAAATCFVTARHNRKRHTRMPPPPRGMPSRISPGSR